MKTIYECIHCGSQSEDRGKIEACEAQGANHIFKKDTTVQFQTRSVPEKWFPGVVHTISFEQSGHRPRYVVRVSPRIMRQIGVSVSLFDGIYENAIKSA